MSHGAAHPGIRRRARAWLRAALGAGLLALSCSGCGIAAASGAPSDHARPGPPESPLASLRLYVSPSSPAAEQAARWRAEGDLQEAGAIEAIARRPTFTWLSGGGQESAAIARRVIAAAARSRTAAELVLYDIPDRDCHGYSSGGAATAGDYRAFIAGVTRVIAQRTAVIVMEPDAIDQAAEGCLGSAGRARERYRLLAGAISSLRHDRRAHVYLDAGNASWLPVSRIVGALRSADVARAAGFALNVANFQTTATSVRYGERLSRALHGAHFIIDTSRNGNGPPRAADGVDTWCNPPGRALGAAPTTRTGIRNLDAELWVKYPGESDGACAAGEPPAGTWWPSYALGLVRAVGQR